MTTNNEGIFKTVLMTNLEYVEAIKNNASVEVQVNLLKQCEILFKTMILDKGLATEYKEYCEQNNR